MRRTIESPNSSSDIVIEANEWTMEFTLDPMEHPIKRLDVYDEDVPEFVRAVVELSAVVDYEGDLFGPWGVLSRVENHLDAYRERLADEGVGDDALDALDSDIEAFGEFKRSLTEARSATHE